MKKPPPASGSVRIDMKLVLRGYKEAGVIRPPPSWLSRITEWSFEFHPGTHPDDAHGAVAAKMVAMLKARKKAKAERTFDDILLTSLVHHRPWTPGQIRSLRGRSSNKDFCERLARALADGRHHILDPVELFMLANWRHLTFGSIWIRTSPGLEAWNPEAACALIASELNLKDVPSVDSYKKKRQRLGLPGKSAYLVRLNAAGHVKFT